MPVPLEMIVPASKVLRCPRCQSDDVRDKIDIPGNSRCNHCYHIWNETSRPPDPQTLLPSGELAGASKCNESDTAFSPYHDYIASIGQVPYCRICNHKDPVGTPFVLCPGKWSLITSVLDDVAQLGNIDLNLLGSAAPAVSLMSQKLTLLNPRFMERLLKEAYARSAETTPHYPC